MFIKKFFNLIGSPWFEAAIWTVAIIYLAVIDPLQDSQVSFCVLDNLGFKHCPGCGLGRSVSYILHGDITSGWETHKAGLLALPVLLYRIGQISYNQIKVFKQNKLSQIQQ